MQKATVHTDTQNSNVKFQCKVINDVENNLKTRDNTNIYKHTYNNMG